MDEYIQRLGITFKHYKSFFHIKKEKMLKQGYEIFRGDIAVEFSHNPKNVREIFESSNHLLVNYCGYVIDRIGYNKLVIVVC